MFTANTHLTWAGFQDIYSKDNSKDTLKSIHYLSFACFTLYAYDPNFGISSSWLTHAP